MKPTGAKSKYAGLFREAEGGVVFLDEIKEMSPAMQAKLLRALQEYTVRPVGSTTEEPFDAQVIVASSASLSADTFRPDLYYRVSTVTTQIPPLRERGDDINLLASHFARYFGKEYGKGPFVVMPPALEYARKYGWPGNVRQLSGVIERIVALCDGPRREIIRRDLEQRITSSSFEPKKPEVTPQTLREIEKAAIVDALNRHNGSVTAAAQDLGIQRRTLYEKLDKFQIHNLLYSQRNYNHGSK